MAITFVCKTLRGDRLEEGIKFKKRIVEFNPRWGMTRHNPSLSTFVLSEKEDGVIKKCSVLRTEHGIVLVPSDEPATEELLLVQNYSTGSGAKRFPNFFVEIPEQRKIASCSTSGGSGWEEWILFHSEKGLGMKIARSFVDERDEENQSFDIHGELKSWSW